MRFLSPGRDPLSVILYKSIQGKDNHESVRDKRRYLLGKAIDWAVRDFHGYETPRGTSYNNYLIMDEGITCEIIKLRVTPMSAAIKKFWKSRGTIIGMPTLNNIMFPAVAEFLTHLRGLRPKNRLVGLSAATAGAAAQ
jgi:flavorubredoxin